jgi:signal transduction histidine kinase
MDMKPVRIAESVEHVANGMRGELERAGLRLEIQKPEHPGEDVHIWADVLRLEQVMTNFLTNAMKFTLPEGIVQVGWRVEVGGNLPDHVTVYVTDSGTGIPDDALPHIFKRYYQAEPRHETRRGMGLGLAICKEIIDIHGGMIGASSVVGKGSLFYFSLPVYQDVSKLAGGE